MTLDTATLLIAAACAIGVVAYWHMSPASDFDMKWMLVESTTGKVSIYKVGQATALAVSTWVLVNETRAGRLNEWLFCGYMVAWAGANLASKIIDKPREAAS